MLNSLIPEPNGLLIKQKNQLFSCFKKKGLSPGDFELTEDATSTYLKHRSTEYRYTITLGSFTQYGSMGALEPYTVPYRIIRSPGKERLQETYYFRSWDNLLVGLDDWIDSLTSELQTPDLWKTVSEDTHLIKLADNQDNRPFTPEEQLKVQKALNEIKAYLIKTHSLTGTRLEAIKARLDYLEESTTRMGRKDWTGILVSSLIGIALTLSLSADGTKELFQFAGQIVKQFLGTVLYLAGPH